VARTASIYHITAEALLLHTGVPTNDARLVDFPPLAPLAASRLAWVMRTTRGRVLRMTHPASAVTLGRYVGFRQPLCRCQHCEMRRAKILPTIKHRSWYEAWRLCCGGCRLPFHSTTTGLLPATREQLWRDAIAGSALAAKFVVGRPSGLLPPDLIWKIGSVRLCASRAPCTLAVHLLVPEATHPSLASSARLQGPTILRSAPPKRLAILALLARAEGRAHEWITNTLEAASPKGRRIVTSALSELPDVIRDEILSRRDGPSKERWTVRNGALIVQHQQIRLKTAANLRQINEACRKLEAILHQTPTDSQN